MHNTEEKGKSALLNLECALLSRRPKRALRSVPSMLRASYAAEGHSGLFRYQYILRSFVVPFTCREVMPVIESEGAGHYARLPITIL